MGVYQMLPWLYEGGTFKGRRCRLRKTPLLGAFYSDASYLSKFTEFGE